MFDYRIISLSPTQLEQRRTQLDRSGFLAWISPIVLLCVVYVVRRVIGPVISGLGKDVQLSNPLGSSRTRMKTRIQILIRRMSWILNSTFIPEFGPLHVQLLGLLYGGWLLYIIFRGTGNDYMHLTKAFGHVAITQLPMQYLLSFKSPLSPVALATGLTHERLNAYHRLFGRIVHVLLAAHALLYLRFFAVAGLLPKRIKDRDVRLGLLAFWLMNILALPALPWIRKRAYHRLFYRSHIVISALLVGILFFHVPYTRRYMLQAGVFWLAGGLLRKRASVRGTLTSESIEGTELLKTKITVEPSRQWATWTPGQHVYLRQTGLGPKNPFTILHVDKSSNGQGMKMQLVVRNLKGQQTAHLGSLAVERRTTLFEIEGPYGESGVYLPGLIAQGEDAGQILVVAGGVGATYALPVYLSLLKARPTTAGLKLLWFVKTLADATWAEAYLERASKKVDVEIYVTQPSPALPQAMNKVSGVTVVQNGSRPDLARVIDPILNLKSETAGSKRDPRKLKKTDEKVTVLVCGPAGLSRSLRKEVGRHVLGYGREVEWYEEQFGLGGF